MRSSFLAIAVGLSVAGFASNAFASTNYRTGSSMSESGPSR